MARPSAKKRVVRAKSAASKTPSTRSPRPARKVASAVPASKAVRPKTGARLASYADTVWDRLHALYPDAHCELDFRSPCELLVATILSAQCTDKRVNMVTPVLFARYPGPQQLAIASPDDSRTSSAAPAFFATRPRALLGVANAVVERHRRPRTLHHGGARRASGSRSQDGQRRPRQRVQHQRRRRRRYPRRAARGTTRPNERNRSGQGGAQPDGHLPGRSMDAPFSPAHLARPTRLRGSQTTVR